MFKKGLIFTMISMLWGANVYADPIIDKVSGNFSNGSTITISGSGFGTKATATPSKWDDFDNGSNGSTITGWTAEYGPVTPPIYSDENLRTENGLNFKVRHARNTTSSTEGYCDLRHSVPEGFEKAYISFWTRWNWGPETGSATDFQSKMWRVCESYPMQTGESSISNFNWYRGSFYLQYNNGSKAGTVNMGAYADQEWIRVEAELSMGTPNTADGVIRVRYSTTDGSTFKTVTNANKVIRTSSSQLWKMFKIGDWFGNVVNESSINVNQEYYVDDVYFDTTWQRVEIGDASTFDACTRREVQIPTVWNDGSISVTVNQGAFDGGTAFLYVVDESGTPNAIGHPITFGSSADDTNTPANPTGINIIILP